MSFDSLLLSHWWLGAVLMAVTAISDYALTLLGAALSRNISHRLTIEGSYETVPLFQSDINAGRIISVRFLLTLLILVGLIGSAGKFGQSLGMDSKACVFLVGFLMLIEVPIHVRHASNIVRF